MTGYALKLIPAILIILGGLLLLLAHGIKIINGQERWTRIVPAIVIIGGGIGLLVFHLSVP